MRLTLLLLRTVLLGLFISGAVCRGGIAAYSDPGKIDFDTAMERLNSYGTWAKVGDKWAYTPLDHGTPYTNGRWLYTEYGWYWQGNSAYSWLTEHYGYWKRGADKVWAWYPGPIWLPQIVEIRGSPAGIGWRSGEVDHDGNFVEQPADRFTKTDEWTFVTPAQFAQPITPSSIPKGPAEEQMLEQSTESIHSYLTYRELDRPGPHPADFINLGDNKMYAPMTDAERARALRPVAMATAEARKAKSKSPIDPAKLAASLTASEAVPDIPQQPGADDPNDDPRQVKYWVTMSLPNPWTPRPPDAKRDELYIYRPDFYQDEDGIQRRITLWLDPSLRSSEAIHLADILKNAKPASAPTSGYSAVSAAPAHDFASPFDDGFGGGAPAGSTKTKPTTEPSVNMAGAPVVETPSTNAAPQPAAIPAAPAVPDGSPAPSSLAPAPAHARQAAQ